MRQGLLRLLASGLPKRQAQVLAAAAVQLRGEPEGALSLIDLVKLTGISKSHVSECLSALDRAGHLKRLEGGQGRVGIYRLMVSLAEPMAKLNGRALNLKLRDALWPAMRAAMICYGKHPTEECGTTRLTMLARVVREFDNREAVLADLVHGYVAFHWGNDRFDLLRYMVVETLCRPSKREKYLEAYDEAIAAGVSPPWLLPPESHRKPTNDDWDRELREHYFQKRTP